MGSLSNVYLYVIIGGDMVMQSDIISLDGWQNWKEAEISNISLNGEDDVTVGVYVAGSGALRRNSSYKRDVFRRTSHEFF